MKVRKAACDLCGQPGVEVYHFDGLYRFGAHATMGEKVGRCVRSDREVGSKLLLRIRETSPGKSQGLRPLTT